MRPSILLFFALVLVGLASFLFVSGRGVVERSASTASVETPAIADGPARRAAAERAADSANKPVAPAAGPVVQRSPAASRQITPDIVGPSDIETDECSGQRPVNR